MLFVETDCYCLIHSLPCISTYLNFRLEIRMYFHTCGNLTHQLVWLTCIDYIGRCKSQQTYAAKDAWPKYLKI